LSARALLFFLVLASAWAVRVSAAGSSAPKDDVWDFVPPETDRPACDLEARKLPQGDVLLTYGARCVEYRPQEIKNVTFLGRKTVHSVKEAFSGKHVSAVVESEIRTGNGDLIWTIGPRAHPRCYVALEGSLGIYKVGGPPNYSRIPVVQKRLLWILDPPRHYTAPFSPPCGNKVPFTAWAETIGDYIVSLDDETFVLIDSENVVAVRFDQNLQTRSRLVNRRLFPIDAAEFDRAVQPRRNLTETHQVVRRFVEKLQRDEK
jgi:hypothetical protein